MVVLQLYCLLGNMKYSILKEKAREKAILYQLEYIDKNMSYSEAAYYSDMFYKLGKRYGLLKEFRENCII